MIKDAPGVIFKVLKYNKSTNSNQSKKSRDHYYKNGSYLDYILRPDAIFNLDLTDEEVTKLYNLRNGNNSQKNEYRKILKGINSKFKSTGLYGKNGIMNEDQVKDLRKNMKKLDDNQIIWDTIISFSEKFIKNNSLYTPEKIEKALSKEIPKFLKNNGMNPEKMEWFYTMHTNTDNNHIHLGFYEKEPTDFDWIRDKDKNQVLNKYGKPIGKRIYKRTGVLKSKAEFRAGIDLEIQKEFINSQKFNKDKSHLRTQFKESWFEIDKIDNKISWNECKQIYVDINKSKVELLDKIEMFSYSLKEKLLLNFETFKDIPIKKIGYGSKFLTETDREMIDEITKDFINSDLNLKNTYDSFINENNERADKISKIYAMYEFDELKIEEQPISLTTEDLLKNEKDWNLNDPIDKLKFQRLKFRNQHIKSKNIDGYYQGVLPEFGQKLLRKIINKWKADEWKPKPWLEFNPSGYKRNKKYFSSLLYLPKNLFKLIQKEKQKAIKTANRIEHDI